ncbi:MAG: HK97 family phage prohead protease [Acidimicrobiales bacterium]
MNLSERGQLRNVPEFRELAFADAEVRMDAVGAGWTFRGYASVFDSPYSIVDAYGEYTEVVTRSAFDKTLASDADCVLLIGHEGAPLARTKSRTMTLRTDGKGLLTEARLDPSNPRAQELRSMVDRGDMDEMSFSFRDELPSWNSSYTARSLVSVSLNHGDCSAVAFGANAATKGLVSMRSYTAEVRAKYSAAQLAAMLKAGKAFPNANGDPSYPIGDAADLRLAIHAVGRGSSSHDKIRAYIVRRAKALALSSLIPSNWNSDGSLSQSNAAGRLGEHRSPLHANVTGSHTHRHSTLGSSGWKTHVHEHAHDGDASHDHTHDALAQAAADADAATSQVEDPTQTLRGRADRRW